MGIIKSALDQRNRDSVAEKLRRRRFAFFKSFIRSLPLPLKILDVGGVQIFWDTMEFRPGEGCDIWLLNIAECSASPPFRCVRGDARDMKQFEDKEFDVVFSNSVIEHVGSYDDQMRMANEIRRVGKRYFLQTPNRYFPIEGHFLFPLFQFFPEGIRVGLTTHFDLGWVGRIPNRGEAKEAVRSVRLLTKKELQEIFPDGKIFKERIFGLTKSFIVYKR